MAQIAYKELKQGRTNLKELNDKAPQTGFLYRTFVNDPFGSSMDILTVNNGFLQYTILFQRGMDIGNMWYKNKKIGWRRELSFLLHPENVNLQEAFVHVNGENVEGLGWLRGFYAMDTMVGPKHFGAPCVDEQTGEKLTLHDRNSYSLTDMDSILIEIESSKIEVAGMVPVLYKGEAQFRRTTEISTGYMRNSLLRADTTDNISKRPQIFDDGHHIQFGSDLLWEGSRYVCSGELKARDEEAKKYLKEALEVPAPTAEFFQERCYFIEPKPIKRAVDGVFLSGEGESDVTVQMMMTEDRSLGGFVAHRISDYSKVTLWQQYGGWQFDGNQDEPIWYTAAIEPANSFPDDRNNKREELRVLSPGQKISRTVEIGALDGERVIKLEEAINDAFKR
ncbi:DUF4432 family protein [bacterium]|nr:DUF4432 family protein [bacterium]